MKYIERLKALINYLENEENQNDNNNMILDNSSIKIFIIFLPKMI